MTVARDQHNQGSDTLFCILLFIFSFLLYGNTLSGGASYVWDDRAAILSNGDVSSTNPLKDVFYHDFWGQDISLADSHKSYRPVTVLTFRFNHWLHGYSPFGFHALNIFFYAVGVVVYYNWARQWSNQFVSRVAALLYCSHPIHVEAVASLVGRADSLCGLFYLTAIYLYTCGSRRKWYSSTSGLPSLMISTWTTAETVATEADSASTKNGATTTSTRAVASSISNATTLITMSAPMKSLSSSSSSSSYSRFFFNISTALYFLSSLLAALLASFSKEVGMTVFLIFICLEILDLMSQTIRRIAESSEKNSKDVELEKNISIKKGIIKYNLFSLPCKYFYNFVQLIYNIRPQIKSLFRLFASIGIIIFLLYHRYKINSGTLYKWTVLENHISLLPSFKMRALSYAQSHFWYLFKLIYPRYLCFDYGFSCLPIISSILDLRNILPLLTYSSLLLFLSYSILKMKYNIILSLLLMLIPLLPALNILFPIGTILAERLLFIPSCGYCLILSEIFVGELKLDFISIFFNMRNFLFYQFTNNITPPFMHFKILKSLQLGHLKIPILDILEFKDSDEIQIKKKSFSTTKSEEINFIGINTIKKNEKIKKNVRFCDENKAKVKDKSSKSSKNSENLNIPISNKIEKNAIFSEEKNVFVLRKYFFSYEKFFFPILLCIFYSYRVVTRNADWNSEIQLYRSALNVCPLSVKVCMYVHYV